MIFLRDSIQFVFFILPLHSLTNVVNSQWTKSASIVSLHDSISVKAHFALRLNVDTEFGLLQGHGNSNKYNYFNDQVCAVIAKENDEDIESLLTRNYLSRPQMLITQQLRGGGIFERTNKWIGSSPNRCWTSLALAIAIEICATTMMKIASDENCIKRTILSTAAYLTSLFLFGSSLAHIDVGIAYAIWSALGTLFVSVAGVTMFGEEFTAIKVVSMILILVGVVGLNYKSR
jgi:small multidrug resistance pump